MINTDINTDVSGKWVPIAEALKLLEKIQELQKQLYGSRYSMKNNRNNYNNCRPYSWWIRLIDKWFGIRMSCDQRCHYNYDAPCQYPKKDCSVSHHATQEKK